LPLIAEKIIMKNKTLKIISNFVIVTSIILLILNYNEIDFNDLKKETMIGIIGNILIIIGMIFTLISIKKEN